MIGTSSTSRSIVLSTYRERPDVREHKRCGDSGSKGGGMCSAESVGGTLVAGVWRSCLRHLYAR